MYQKEVKHTDLSFSNHHDLKRCHCFSHHKVIGVKGSRRGSGFSFHTSGRVHTQVRTGRVCWVVGWRRSLTFLVHGRCRFSVFLSLRLCCLGSCDVCLDWDRLPSPPCPRTIVLTISTALWCLRVKVPRPGVSVVLGKALLRLACQAPAMWGPFCHPYWIPIVRFYHLNNISYSAER